MLVEFDQGYQDAKQHIIEESDGAKQNLQEIAQKSLDRLNEISAELLAQVTQTRQQQQPALSLIHI